MQLSTTQIQGITCNNTTQKGIDHRVLGIGAMMDFMVYVGLWVVI